MHELMTHEKGLVLNLDLDEEIPHVLVGDHLRVKQILLNLLSNAVKFTAKGSITISTRLLERHDSAMLIQMDVRDTGIGISTEALGAIFEPFVQGDGSTTRKYGGTGLGLTICRRVAEIMGGSISIESIPDVGSCFTVTLPFSAAKNTDSTLPAYKETIGWDGPPLRILFTEDDKVNISIGASMFRKLGHEVVVAENGRECLTALEQGTFDVVLMDIQMPVMNGEEALLEIRRKEQETSRHQPVIALTAFSMRGEEKRFLEEGFDGYVSKPFAVKELIFEIKRVIGMTGTTVNDDTKEDSHE